MDRMIRIAIDEMSEGIQILDHSWKYLYVNHAAALQGKSSQEDLIEKQIQDCYPGIDQSTLWRDMQYVMEQKVPLRIENEFEFPDKSKGWFELHIEPHSHGILIRSFDISDRKKLEEQLRSAQRMETISRLAACIAHDLNNKLGISLTFGEIAQEAASGEVKSYLQKIIQATKDSAGIVKKLMALSRKQVLSHQILDLNCFVDSVQHGIKALIGKAAELEFKSSEELLPIKADPAELEQMILNLCVNARDAMPAGGRIVVRTALATLDEEYAKNHAHVTPGEFALIEVSDTGTGMDKATLTRVFEPFFTTKAAGKGTGLGLAIVQGFVHQCNGHIWAYSEPGLGTTFKVYLPVTSHLPQKSSGWTGEAASTGCELVLVAEDEEVLRAGVIQTLSNAGYRVLAASSADEAELLLTEGPESPALLLTDVMLGSSHGVALAEKAKKLCPGLKVVFTSGYAADLLDFHGLSADEILLIRKPVMVRDLLRTVRGVLDGNITAAVI